MNDPVRVLHVGDASWVSEQLAADEQFVVETAASASEGHERRADSEFDCIVTEDDLPDSDGVSFLEGVREVSPDLPVVLCPAEGSEAIASAAISAGVTDYVTQSDGDCSQLPARITDAVSQYRTDSDARETKQVLETILDDVPIVIYTLDTEGTFTRSKGHALRRLGLEPDEAVGESIYDLFGEFPEIIEHYEQALEGERVGTTVDLGDVVFQSWYQPLEDAEGTVTGVAGHSVDITERKRHEQTLRTLHESTRQLVRSNSPREVSRRIVDAASRLLDIDDAAVLLYDPEAVALVPEVLTHPVEVKRPVVEPDDGDGAWEAFVSGETVVTDGATAGTALPYESAVLLPLGDHGVFVLGKHTAVPFDDRTVNPAEILAANAEVALERISREQELETQDEELRARAARLEQLDQVNERIREILYGMIQATTREEIEEIVCSELVAADRFELACLGEYDAQDDAVRIRHSAGTNQEYFDAVALAGESQEPTRRAAQSREVVSVSGIGEQPKGEKWRQEALVRGYQSVLAVPLRHHDVPYGVVSVYADSADAFDAETQELFVELATAITHALRAVLQRDALLGDQQVELVFTVEDGTMPLFTLSRRLGAELLVEHVLGGADTHLAYGTVTGVDAEQLRTVTADMTSIDSVRVLTTEHDTLHVEFHITGESIPTTIAEQGGAFQQLDATNGDGQVSMLFPASAKINEFIEMFVTRYPGSQLSARREHTAPEATRAGVEATVTDRQLEILHAAYHSGFFEWPRDSTGEEIAASLDISPSAFRENLRRAERNLLEWFVEATQQTPESR